MRRPCARDRFKKSTERVSSKMKGFKRMPNISQRTVPSKATTLTKANRMRRVQVGIYMCEFVSVAFNVIDSPSLA